MPKRTYAGTEDRTVIVSAYGEAMQDYTGKLPPVRVSDLLQEYNGNKSDLARALAGVGSGKLPSKGTAERTFYDTQLKNIGRWLAYEGGSRDKNKARNPENASSGTQERLKDLSAQKNPPQSMSISITGWIGYDDDYRYRSITISPPKYQIDTQKFVNAMRAGDTKSAWKEVFSPYAKALGVAEAESISIDFREE